MMKFHTLAMLVMLPCAWGASAAGSHQAAHRAGYQSVSSYKGQQSGVRLDYRWQTKPNVGQPTELALRFSKISAPEGATVRLTADPELKLETQGLAEQISGAAPVEASVRVTPQSEGLWYVNVFITQAGRSDVHSIPLRVGTGSARLKHAGQLTTDAAGQKVISLPAQP